MSAIVAHHGPWDEHSRQSQPLRFIEKYLSKLDSLDLASKKSSAFYASLAIFHDTKGDVHISGDHIWGWITRQTTPFVQMRHEVVELRVVSEPEGRDIDHHIVYGEFLTHFQLKGDEEEIIAPRLFVWTLCETERGVGTEGLQIQEARLFWDTGIIGRYVTERKKRGSG